MLSPAAHSYSGTARIAAVLLLFALALWIELYLARVTGTRFLFAAFSLTIAFGIWCTGPTSGLCLVLMAGLATDYFILGPGQLFDAAGQADGFVLAGVLTCWTGLCFLSRRVFKRLDGEHTARLGAARAAALSHRLSQLTAALGQARTSDGAIEASLQESLHWLGADAGMFLLIDDDRRHARAVRTVGYPADAAPSARPIPLDLASPVSEAVRRMAPVVVESARARRSEFFEWSSTEPWRRYEATIVLPVTLDRRVVALAQLDFLKARSFSAEDHKFLTALSAHAAQTLDRTWQYEAVQRARIEAEDLRARADAELVERQKTEQALRASETRYRALATRTARLHGLTAGLSEGVTLTAVARAIVQHGMVVVGAAAGALELLVENGTQFETQYAEGLAAGSGERTRVGVDEGLCATEVVRGGRPLFIGSFAGEQDKYWRSASSAADAGFTSMAAMPLLVDGMAIGVLTFHFSVPVNFDEEYRALLISVAQHCTQAVDRARLYEGAERARADAEAATRLKDEFVSMVSHELRTPLNAILGWASMLQTGSLDAAAIPRAVDAMHRNALRQAKLVDDLLDFSRLAVGRATLDLEMIDAPALVRAVVESVIPVAAAQQITLSSSPIPDVTIRGDARRLEQVFTNLLGNALKFTKAGGSVTVEAQCLDRQIEVRVRDNGIGISPEFLPFVFDRFRQADTSPAGNRSGLGLGLSIAKRLVEAHKGTIAVESAGKDRGATFIVRLPLIGPTADRPAESPASVVQATRPRLDGIRVLIVDDETDARDVIGKALEECGATIAMASRTKDAVDILEHADIDVLLADLVMPDEDGYALIRHLRSAPDGRLASIPAAAVTARAGDHERHKALASGFQVYVTKPIEPLDLACTVGQLFADGVDPVAAR